MTNAQTILSQLGGNKFRVMTGARDFVGSDNALHFALPARMARNKANKVRVTLTPADLYTVEFFAARGVSLKSISTHGDVYADQLAALFEAETGLATRL